MVHGLLADPLPLRAPLPRWIAAVSQDRDGRRCDHDPILLQLVTEFMCVGVFLLRLPSPKIVKMPTSRRITDSPEKAREMLEKQF